MSEPSSIEKALEALEIERDVTAQDLEKLNQAIAALKALNGDEEPKPRGRGKSRGGG